MERASGLLFFCIASGTLAPLFAGWVIHQALGQPLLYAPVMNSIFGILPLNFHEWMLVLAFSVPVIIVDEILKVFGRIMNERELKQRLTQVHEKKVQ